MGWKYANLEERLMANSVAEWNPDLQSYCWIWLGPRLVARVQDYGRLNLRVGGKHVTKLAHRVSYETFKGVEIPVGYEVDHACGNGLCIAPDHLKAMPHSDNMIEWHRRRKK
jgi:hypothetical protein